LSSLDFTHKKGDTFEAVNFEIKINSTAVNLTDCIIRMQLKKSCGENPKLSLTSVSNNGIKITNALSGLFKINEQIIDIEPFNYFYDIEIAFADDTVKTYISGRFNVTCDITR
jgi:hypothetical protein